MNTKKWIILCAVLLVAVLVLPFPQHVNQTMKGIVYHEIGKDEEEADLSIRGWELHFLIFRDLYQYKITVRTAGAEQTFETPMQQAFSFSKDWDYLAMPPVYDEAVNRYTYSGTLLISKSRKEIYIEKTGISTWKDCNILGSADSNADYQTLEEKIPIARER